MDKQEREWNRNALNHRYTRLVVDDKAAQWLTAAYRLRNDYLHSLAEPSRKLTWTDLARARSAVATAVGKYLDFAIQQPELNRLRVLAHGHSFPLLAAAAGAHLIRTPSSTHTLQW